MEFLGDFSEVDWQQVPVADSVNHLCSKSGSLVRFRCMIQNVYDIEFFMSRFEIVNELTGEREMIQGGSLGDGLKTRSGFAVDFNTAVSEERLPLVCVDIPGETSWVKMVTRTEDKRVSEFNHDFALKRRLQQDEEPATLGKRKCLSTTEERNTSLAASHSQPTGPIIPVQNLGVVVKVYGEDCKNGHLKVNNIVEFLAIVEGNSIDQESEFEDQRSAFPQLHAVRMRRLSRPDYSPALEQFLFEERTIVRSRVVSEVADLRQKVLDLLASAVNSDYLVAEYVLVNILSRVTSRVHQLPVGRFSLALTGWPQSSAPENQTQKIRSTQTNRLVAVLSTLLPRVVDLSLNLEELNGSLWFPKKDHNTEILSTGQLQVANATQMVMDETAMLPGQLNETGLKNLEAVNIMILQQVVPFDFVFYPLNMPADVPILVLTQGKSLFPVECSVRLLSSIPEGTATRGEFVDEEALRLCRLYIEMVRDLDAQPNEHVSHLIQEYFVSERQRDSKQVTQSTLHCWLSLARLQATSLGATEVTPEHWLRVVEMERQRLAREQPHQASV